MDCRKCTSCDRRCMCAMEPFDERANAPRSGGVPLSVASKGDSGKVARLTGDRDMKSYLTGLGFNPGSIVSIVRKQGEDLVVEIRDTRIAMGPSIARRIYFLPEVIE